MSAPVENQNTMRILGVVMAIASIIQVLLSHIQEKLRKYAVLMLEVFLSDWSFGRCLCDDQLESRRLVGRFAVLRQRHLRCDFHRPVSLTNIVSAGVIITFFTFDASDALSSQDVSSRSSPSS
jgi:hypothetical protein